MLADGIEEDRLVGETYELAGSKVLTMADVTQLIYRAEGKSVTIVPVPMELANAGLAVADVVPGAPMGKDQYRSLKFDNTTDQNAIVSFGVSDVDITIFRKYLCLVCPILL
jgi:NADH dehydrogenase